MLLVDQGHLLAPFFFNREAAASWAQVSLKRFSLKRLYWPKASGKGQQTSQTKPRDTNKCANRLPPHAEAQMQRKLQSTHTNKIKERSTQPRVTQRVLGTLIMLRKHHFFHVDIMDRRAQRTQARPAAFPQYFREEGYGPS